MFQFPTLAVDCPVRRLSGDARLILLALACAILAVPGCATIRRYNPLTAQVIESRQLTQQAQAAIHQQQWDAAESDLLDAIRRCPQDDTARSCLAEVLWNRGANRAAIEQLAKSIELAGHKSPLALTKLGRMELAEGELAAALGHANEAIQLDSQLADAWLLRGLVLRQQGDIEQALASYFRSLSLWEENSRTRLEIAEIYHGRGQPREALAVLEAAVAPGRTPCPLRPDICFLRGLVLLDLDRPRDAAAALADARAQGLTDPVLLTHLARAHLAAGQLGLARAVTQQALGETKPEQQAALYELLERIEVASRRPRGENWR